MDDLFLVLEVLSCILEIQKDLVEVLLEALGSYSGNRIRLMYRSGYAHLGCGNKDRPAYVSSRAYYDIRLEFFYYLFCSDGRYEGKICRLDIGGRQTASDPLNIHVVHLVPFLAHELILHTLGSSDKCDLRVGYIFLYSSGNGERGIDMASRTASGH